MLGYVALQGQRGMELTGHWLILPDFPSFAVKAKAEGAIVSFFQTLSGKPRSWVPNFFFSFFFLMLGCRLTQRGMELTGYWLILPDFPSFVVKAKVEGDSFRKTSELGTELMHDVRQTSGLRGKSEGRMRGKSITNSRCILFYLCITMFT